MGKNSTDKNNHKKSKVLIFLCFLLLVASGSILIFLNEMRKDLIEDCEDNLVREVRQSAREISDSIDSKFAILETVQDLLSRSYELGSDMAHSMEASKERYQMSFLGVVDRDYNYYDSTGKIFPNTPKENVDRALAGEYVVARVSDSLSPDGIVFMIPYKENGEIVGTACSKYTEEKLLVEFSTKTQDAAEVVIDTNGNILLISEDFENYSEGISWDEFSNNGKTWENKEQFDDHMQSEGYAVASAINKYGRKIYFSVARVDNYREFYVVRLTNSDVVDKEIANSMVSLYIIMGVVAVFMVCLIVYVVVAYFKNRKELYNVAYIDQLTGIPSKVRHKMDVQELVNKQETRYAYVTFDINNFKYINEMFDYEYGNRILIHIANVLRQFVNKGELYARISADNFALLLEDTGTQKELVDRINRLFQMILTYHESAENLNVCTLKFSCGVYRIEGIKDVNTIRANANLARTESKKRVLEEIVFYDEEFKARKVEEKELEYEAQEALNNGQFQVYFQPKYDVETEQIIGAEALVRWKHPERGLLSPGQFIPVFEANGFITELDLYVLDRVCELIETWQKDGTLPVCISVNLSRVHLHEQDLVERLTEVIKKHNVLPEYIEFELTESALYEETERLLYIMSEIKKAGFRLSMDDFGSGYSSLNLLRRLPVDVLKLDKMFLEECDEMDDETRGKQIVIHVISMAKDLQMDVLAEGVETKEQKDFLQGARCDMIQGFYFAKPMTMQSFEQLYKGQIDL